MSGQVGNMILGAPDWKVPAIVLASMVILAVMWSYGTCKSSTRRVRALAATLKAVGIIALAICLVEPLFSGVRPRPGANLFSVLVDDSKSLQIRDEGERRTRAQLLAGWLDETSGWLTRLNQDFDVRNFAFGDRARLVTDFAELAYEASQSNLFTSISEVARRHQNRAHAGILLLTDGNATDLDPAMDWNQSPPVYPVVLGKQSTKQDLQIKSVSVSESNFEAAPITLTAEIQGHGMENEPVLLQLLDEKEEVVQRHQVIGLEEGSATKQRLQLKPSRRGVNFYRLRVIRQSEEKSIDRPERIREATFENNTRLVMVDRGGGPYRVLYVTGRPNWEFKFLRRALQEDAEVNLVGLVRIAKREPKFTFRGHTGERTNPIFRGFENQDDEQVEQYDRPVLIRLGTEDQQELRDGFPKAADQLFRYHALVLDDLEADFFTQDQMTLVQNFVDKRGGGVLMLGGQESFVKGKYRRTPIGELLPVYLDRPPANPIEGPFRLTLTADGWLQPWVRTQATEQQERRRLDNFKGFKTLNRVTNIKPGATVLAKVESPDGEFPGLVVQRFGKGRSAALLVGDLWKAKLREHEKRPSDLEKSWRQTIRWLVSDVPKKVEVRTGQLERGRGDVVQMVVSVRDELFDPLENAQVLVKVKTPAGRQIEVPTEPSTVRSGEYVATFTCKDSGAYRGSAEVVGPDGTEIGQRQFGWTSEPSSDEFRVLTANRELLETIAEQTGGEVVNLEDLSEFVASLPNRKIPIVEPWIYPLWHQWTVFLISMACLIGEWGLRRAHGLP